MSDFRIERPIVLVDGRWLNVQAVLDFRSQFGDERDIGAEAAPGNTWEHWRPTGKEASMIVLEMPDGAKRTIYCASLRGSLRPSGRSLFMVAALLTKAGYEWQIEAIAEHEDR